MEGTGTQTRLFSLRSIILHIARFDFGADSPNLKVTIWCPGLVHDKLWSPCRPYPSTRLPGNVKRANHAHIHKKEVIK